MSQSKLADNLLVVVCTSLLLFVFTPTIASVPCTEQNAAQKLRLKVILFQYSGAEEGESKNHFSNFKEIMRTKITTLVQESQSLGVLHFVKSGNPLKYLDDLQVLFRPKDPATSIRQRRQHWRQTQSLELLRGSVFSSVPYYYVQSDIFIGDLKGRYPRENVSVALPIAPLEFSRTTDSHSVVTLYTLAMDAAQLGCDPDVIWTFLESAKSKLQDLKRGGRTLEGHLIELEQAIDNEISSLKRGTP